MKYMHQKMVQCPKAFDCPYCSSTKCVRRGKVKNIQVYTCKTCGKSFRDTTNTSLHRLHKKVKVSKYLQAMRLGLSVRKAAVFAGVSKNTSFAWRHKFLCSASLMSRPQEANTVLSASLLTTPYSAKGRRKKREPDQSAVKSLLLVTESQIGLDTLAKPYSRYEIAMHLLQSINDGFIVQKPDSLLTRTLKKQQNTKILTSRFHKKRYRVLSDRAEKDLFSWMKRFKGVASKYLQNYWSWFLLKNRCLKLYAFVAGFNKSCVDTRCLDEYFAIKNR